MTSANRLRKFARLTRQAGATSLVELAFVLAASAVLVAALVPSNDADNTKGTALLSNVKTLSDGFLRAKNALGCYPSVPSVLWSGVQATAANLYCGVDGTQVWDGPYVPTQPTDAATGDVQMSSIAPGVLATISREATPATGLGEYYFIHVSGVPNNVILAALRKCNGSNATTATFQGGSCRGTPGTGGTGTFDYKVEETAG